MSGTRRWPRLELALSVRLRFADVTELAEAETINVSFGGVFIRMERPREVGTSVVIEARVGLRPPLRLEGVVVRTVPDPDDPSPQDHLPRGMGIVLVSPPAEWEAIVEEIRRQKAAGADDGS